MRERMADCKWRLSETRSCETCGKSFHPNVGSTGRFCSVQCFHVTRRVPRRTCECCGATIRILHYKRYCSWDCYRASLPPKKQIVCQGCGRTFTPPRGVTNANGNPRTYCSWACFTATVRTRPAVCSGCGRTFVRRRPHPPNRRFCSLECYWESLAGEGSPTWNGGTSGDPVRECRRYARESGWPADLSSIAVAILNTLAAVGVPLSSGELARSLSGADGVKKTGAAIGRAAPNLLRRGLLIRLSGGKDSRRRDLRTYALGPIALSILKERAQCKLNDETPR
jgi:hypothetical protein